MGQPRGRRSQADHAAICAAPLRCYEAELSLKRWIAAALASDTPPPPSQVASLVVAWEAQPMLQPLVAYQRGVAEQAALETALDAAALDGVEKEGGGGGERRPPPLRPQHDAAAADDAEQYQQRPETPQR